MAQLTQATWEVASIRFVAYGGDVGGGPNPVCYLQASRRPFDVGIILFGPVLFGFTKIELAVSTSDLEGF